VCLLNDTKIQSYAASAIQLIEHDQPFWAKDSRRCNCSTPVKEIAIRQIIRCNAQIHTDVRRDLVEPPALLGREATIIRLLLRQPALIARLHLLRVRCQLLVQLYRMPH
jgi:hypothetical protein